MAGNRLTLHGPDGQDNHADHLFAFAHEARKRMVDTVEEKTGKAIVIVDDEISFIHLLERLLGEHFRCPVLAYSNPLKMLEALPHLDIGILVTDYYMPHCNGFNLIRKVSEFSPNPPPCLLITGHSLDEDGETVRPPQLKAVLTKPFRWQQLASLIEKHWPADAPSPLRESLHG